VARIDFIMQARHNTIFIPTEHFNAMTHIQCASRLSLPIVAYECQDLVITQSTKITYELDPLSWRLDA
jgi:hypothetical protein